MLQLRVDQVAQLQQSAILKTCAVKVGYFGQPDFYFRKSGLQLLMLADHTQLGFRILHYRLGADDNITHALTAYAVIFRDLG